MWLHIRIFGYLDIAYLDKFFSLLFFDFKWTFSTMISRIKKYFDFKWTFSTMISRMKKYFDISTDVMCKLYSHPAGIYLFKVNNRNTRTRCEIYPELTIKTPERRQWRRSGVSIVNFELLSHLALVVLLLIMNCNCQLCKKSFSWWT